MRTLEQFINESKAKHIETTVGQYINFYLGEPLDKLTAKDFEEGDTYWDLVEGTPFYSYDELIKFLKAHADEKIDLTEMKLSNPNVVDHVFKLDDKGDMITFYTQSLKPYKK